MKYNIVYVGMNKEVQAIISLLDFENINWDFTEDGSYLRFTNGHDIPCVMVDDDTLVTGFYSLVDYLRENGLCNC